MSPPRRFDNGDRSEWMLRSEAAEIFDVSVRTIQRWVHRWRGRHLRTMLVPRGKQRVMLLHRGDVERLHKTRFGRPPYQIDADVMAAIVRGESPDVIVRNFHVSLDELERIRERFLRMTDARLIEGPSVRQICEALEISQLEITQVVTALRALRQIRMLMDMGDAEHPTLVAAIQALLERHSRLVAERRSSEIRAVIKPIESGEDVDGMSQDRKSRAGGTE